MSALALLQDLKHAVMVFSIIIAIRGVYVAFRQDRKELSIDRVRWPRCVGAAIALLKLFGTPQGMILPIALAMAIRGMYVAAKSAPDEFNVTEVRWGRCILTGLSSAAAVLVHAVCS